MPLSFYLVGGTILAALAYIVITVWRERDRYTNMDEWGDND